MEQSRHKRHKSKKLIQKDEVFIRITRLFWDKSEKKAFFVDIHMLPLFPWRFVVFAVSEEHSMRDSAKSCVKLVIPLDGTVEFQNTLGT